MASWLNAAVAAAVTMSAADTEQSSSPKLAERLEKDLATDPPCHPRACAIQGCLKRSNYNQDRCQHLVDALYDCCQAFYERQGDSATTPSCPRPDLLRLKLAQREKAKP